MAIESLSETGESSRGRKLVLWMQRHPIELILFTTISLTILYFFGVWGKFGNNGKLSVLHWMWRICEPGGKYDYEHGRFIPLVIGVILWRSRKEIGSAQRGSSTAGLIIMVIGVLFFILSARTVQARIGAVAFPMVAWGFIAFVWGKHVARHFIFPCLLFGFAIPMPGTMQATNGLQIIATQVAYHTSSLLGADIVVSGNSINSASGSWPGGLDIAEGCSGIRSLVALTFIAAVLGYFTHSRLWQKLALLASSIPLAILANALRVTTIVLIAEYWSPEFASKTYHNFSGFIFFPLGLAGLLVVSWLLNKGWTKRRSSSSTTRTIIRKTRKEGAEGA